MKRRNIKPLLRVLRLFILMVFCTSFSLLAQDEISRSEISKVDEMTDKLNMKLILSDEQESEVQSILQEYFDGLQNIEGNGKEAEKLKNSADKKIQKLFDKKQTMKFSIIADDWWALAKD